MDFRKTETNSNLHFVRAEERFGEESARAFWRRALKYKCFAFYYGVNKNSLFAPRRKCAALSFGPRLLDGRRGYALLLNAHTAALTITAENPKRNNALIDMACKERLLKIFGAT